MNIRKIITIVFMLVTVVGVQSYQIESMAGFWNLFVGLTWFYAGIGLLVFFLTCLPEKGDELKQNLISTYNNPKSGHMPRWVDCIYYGIIIGALFYNACYLLSVPWFIIMILDLGWRHQAEQCQKQSA